MQEAHRLCFLAVAAATALQEVQILTAAQAPAADEKPPLPPGLQVILYLCLVYFLMYSGLQISQSVKQWTGTRIKGQLEKILESAVAAVDLAPMIGVMFLAVRMRAQQLSPPNGNVPEDMQFFMWAIMWGVIISAACAVLEPYLGGVAVPDKAAYQSVGRQGRKAASGFGFVLQSLFGAGRLIATMLSTVGIVFVMFGIRALSGDKGSKYCTTCQWRYATPVAPAVDCTIWLTLQFFFVYICIEIIRAVNIWMGLGRRTFSLRVLEGAVPSVRLCPMLAVLFIGARMRALQMDLTSPPVWAQFFFYVTTIACAVQTLCAIMLPIASGEGRAELNDDGEVVSTGARAGMVAHVISMVRYVALALMVAGVVVSGYSVYAMEAPYGETPPVSTTIWCVLVLMTAFLTVTLVNTIARTITTVFLGGIKPDYQKVLESAEPALTFVPMMCVLFVGTRMRALQLDPEGAPDWWTQLWMQVCSWMILVQLFCALSTPFFTGELGSIHIEALVAAKLFIGLRYAALFVNIYGIARVMYGMATL